mgnify:CR=1 FL=1
MKQVFEMSRIILLADMNAFYASVTQVLEPKLQGQPLLITGNPAQRRGIVLTASYTAKAKGVKTGMTIREALIYCPEAILRPPNFPAYLQFSKKVFQILQDFSPLVEPYSIDEAFVDLTGTEGLWGPPLKAAQKIKAQIKKETQLLCSIGLGPSKVLAKMASNLQKPDGLTLLTREDLPAKLWPLPIKQLFGVGKHLESKLKNMGIRTIGDLAHFPVELLKQRFGLVGEKLFTYAHGIDTDPVDPQASEKVKSIGHRITLPRDYTEIGEIKVVLLELAEAVCRRARLKNYQGKTISLYVKGADFTRINRSTSLTEPTAYPPFIYDLALHLFKQHWSFTKPVRALGISLSNLKNCPLQPSLFTSQEKLYETIDHIKNKFGEKSLLRGSFLLNEAVFYAPENDNRSPFMVE